MPGLRPQLSPPTCAYTLTHLRSRGSPLFLVTWYWAGGRGRGLSGLGGPGHLSLGGRDFSVFLLVALVAAKLPCTCGQS